MGLYGVTFLGLYGVLGWRMVVGGTDAFFCYLFVHCYAITTNLIFIILRTPINFYQDLEVEVDVSEDYTVGTSKTTTLHIMCCFLFGPLGFLCKCGIEESRQQYDGSVRLCYHISIVTLLSITLWTLFIVLPIIYDEQQDLGFVIGFTVMIYFEMYCFLVYYQTRTHPVKMQCLPYLHPMTLIIVVMVMSFLFTVLISLLLISLCIRLCSLPSACCKALLEAIQRRKEADTEKKEGRSQAYEENSRMPMAPEELEQECAICLEKVTDPDTTQTTTCGHTFHQPCINLWLSSHPGCPICCKPLKKPSNPA
ncbi:unnamed protein product [Moneuplotes crassus]|uniref:RING-type domain-containing protein n=1 Tax=Euplotes crassus TaxID=5936 RepID=A0AAD1XCA8_EUPCR|nr:unnamed protein product [Moneuplotes crassus]